MNTMYERAVNELKLVGAFDEDSEYDGMIGEAVQELLGNLRDQGHSGASCAITVEIFKRLADGGVLTPLTGEPDEWVDHEGLLQNNRCYHVFKDKVRAYDSRGRIFIDKKGDNFTNSNHSAVEVTFPYSPVIEFIEYGTPEAEKYPDVFKE